MLNVFSWRVLADVVNVALLGELGHRGVGEVAPGDGPFVVLVSEHGADGSLFDLVRLQDALEALLGHSVDVVSLGGLPSPGRRCSPGSGLAVTRSDEKRLDDIRDTCAKVASLVERGRPAVDADELLWPALERAIEIAGETGHSGVPGTRALLHGSAHSASGRHVWLVSKAK